MKLEQIEKHKLIQFKNQKVKRLNHLEGMARQMELMQNINVDKVIQTLTDKDRKLAEAQIKNNETSQFMNEVYRTKAKEVDRIKRDAAKETVLKEVAIYKMEELRNEVELLQGDSESAYKVMRDEVFKLRKDVKDQNERNEHLSTKLNSLSQIHAQLSQHQKNEDSLFSYHDTYQDVPSIRGPNPFLGDAKKSYIKKINTEAYLTQEPSALAMFAKNQHNSLLANKGRNKTLADNIVLSAPSKNDFNVELPHFKYNPTFGASRKQLLQNLSDVSMLQSQQQNHQTTMMETLNTSTDQQTRKSSQFKRLAGQPGQYITQLNDRSGELHQSPALQGSAPRGNSMRAKINVRGQRANLAFASHRRSPVNEQQTTGNNDLLHEVSGYHPYANQVAGPAQQHLFDVEVDQASLQGVLGGPVLSKQELRQSQQTPRSVMKAERRKQDSGNVYNSVHLPSLRGQSQTFATVNVPNEESLEEYVGGTGGKPRRRKQLMINDSLSHMSKAQAIQASLLMSMQGGSRTEANAGAYLGLGRQFHKGSQSNAALIQVPQQPTNPDIVLKGTQKQLNPALVTLSPRRSKNSNLLHNPARLGDAGSTSNSASQTMSKRSKQQHNQEENLFSSLIAKNKKEPGTIYQAGFDMHDGHSSSHKRVVFEKTPKVQGQQNVVQVNASSEENSVDGNFVGAVNGGISAGGHYSKRSSEKQQLAKQPPNWGLRNDSQVPQTANQDLTQLTVPDSSEKNENNKSQSCINPLTDEIVNLEYDSRLQDDSELVAYAANETKRTGQFAQQADHTLKASAPTTQNPYTSPPANQPQTHTNKQSEPESSSPYNQSPTRINDQIPSMISTVKLNSSVMDPTLNAIESRVQSAEPVDEENQGDSQDEK